MPTDPAIEAAARALDAAMSNPTMVDCPRCAGNGYHHGFGETGHDPDWCETCGGAQYAMADENEPLVAAIRAYLAALDIEALAECLHDGMIRADPWEGDLAWQDETESDKDFYRYRVRELLDFIAAQPAERTAAEMRREVEE